MKKDQKNIKPDYQILFRSMGEASQMSISFVFFPIVILLIGVWLDKRFDTIPLFILIGILVGIIIFILQVRSAIKKAQKDK
jgi:F0F1-type ATP synthase assembly protein I